MYTHVYVYTALKIQTYILHVYLHMCIRLPCFGMNIRELGRPGGGVEGGGRVLIIGIYTTGSVCITLDLFNSEGERQWLHSLEQSRLLGTQKDKRCKTTLINQAYQSTVTVYMYM